MPLAVFDLAMQRSQHFLTMYSLLHNQRRRGIRSDWAAKFKSLMHWNQGEEVVRVDGENNGSVLLYKGSLDIPADRFQHDYVSELLRSAIVSSVSALDRYLHDQIVQWCWSSLDQKEEDVPKALAYFPIPALEVRKLVLYVRKNPKSRPGERFKALVQEELHKRPLQGPRDIEYAAKLLGISNVWRTLSEKLGDEVEPDAVKAKLSQIVRRRNQIVHEADIYLKLRGTKLHIRKITKSDAQDSVHWISEFVRAMDRVINDD